MEKCLSGKEKKKTFCLVLYKNFSICRILKLVIDNCNLARKMILMYGQLRDKHGLLPVQEGDPPDHQEMRTNAACTLSFLPGC